MIAYVLDSVSLDIKDVILFNSYGIDSNIEFSGKTQIQIVGSRNISEGDFVVINGDGIEINGICDSITSQNENDSHIVYIKTMEHLFNEDVFTDGESLISSTGIEDYIVSVINSNWVNNGDPATEKRFIFARADTHTRINAKISTIGSVENNVFNFKTFLGNCLEYYGIKLNFKFYSSDKTLLISVMKDNSTVQPVDLTLLEYNEEKTVDALAKLKVRWTSDQGETFTNRTYYLKTDRSITTNVADPNRAAGKVDSIYIEAETESEMIEKVTQEFKANSYAHKVSFVLDSNSSLYDSDSFYVGKTCLIKTRSGIRQTIVTSVGKSSNSSFVNVTFGKLKVTLIDKLRGNK